MICFLLQLSNNLLPTQTGMYKGLTLSIIFRHLARQEDCLALKSLKDLEGAHAQYFKDLCRLAYEMTTKYKQVISSQELDDWLGGRGSFIEEAGLYRNAHYLSHTSENWHSSELCFPSLDLPRVFSSLLHSQLPG